jgi:hypothetical protein
MEEAHMTPPVPMIGATVRQGDRVGRVEGIGKPFLDGVLAAYVIGSTFADWWRLDEVTIVHEETALAKRALTA